MHSCSPPRSALPSGRKAAGGPAGLARVVAPSERERVRSGVSSGPGASDCYLSTLAGRLVPRLHLALREAPRAGSVLFLDVQAVFMPGWCLGNN